MVGVAADPTLQNDRPPVVTAPIATDVVPPDDLFNNDDADWAHRWDTEIPLYNILLLYKGWQYEAECNGQNWEVTMQSIILRDGKWIERYRTSLVENGILVVFAYKMWHIII